MAEPHLMDIVRNTFYVFGYNSKKSDFYKLNGYAKLFINYKK